MWNRNIFTSSLKSKGKELVQTITKNVQKDSKFAESLFDSLITGMINKDHLLTDLKSVLRKIHFNLIAEKPFTYEEIIAITFSMIKQVTKMLLLSLNIRHVKNIKNMRDIFNIKTLHIAILTF